MKKVQLTVLSALIAVFAFAQEAETKKIDVDINANGGSAWYTSPIVWVIGAAVFILLLVALTRGGGRRAD